MSKTVIPMDNIQNEVETEWGGTVITVKHYLSVFNMMQFTDGVVRSCFIADTGEYVPEVKDFAIRCAILEYYANIELPAEIEAKCDLVYGTNIVAFVLQYANGEQFNNMRDAIDAKVDNMAQANIEAMNKQMMEIAAGLKDLEKKLEDVFSGVDSNTVSKIAGALANGAFDERKLVQAFSENMAQKNNVIQMPKEGE